MAALVTLAGVYLGYLLYYGKPGIRWQGSPGLSGMRDFFFSGWKFDQLYNFLFVKPFVFITRINKSDVIDRLYNGIAQAWSAVEQTGLLSHKTARCGLYIVGVLAGILFIITLQLLL